MRRRGRRERHFRRCESQRKCMNSDSQIWKGRSEMQRRRGKGEEEQQERHNNSDTAGEEGKEAGRRAGESISR
jgi:hypothetical protein